MADILWIGRVKSKLSLPSHSVIILLFSTADDADVILIFFYCQRTPWEWQSDLIEALRTACNTSLSQAQQTQTNIQQPAVSVNMKTHYPTLKSQRCRRPQSETESDLKHELLLLTFCTLNSLSEHKLCKNKQTKIRKNSISVEAK